MKLRTRSLKLNSQNKNPPTRKTTFKESKKSMFSNERKSRNTNQITTSSSTEHNTNDLNLKKTEEKENRIKKEINEVKMVNYMK